MSARIRSKASMHALQPQLNAFADELGKIAACLGTDGKLKLPKRKKVLTETEEAEKKVTTFFKKLLALHLCHAGVSTAHMGVI